MKISFTIAAISMFLLSNLYSQQASKDFDQVGSFIEQSIENGDPSYFNKVFDKQLLLSKILVKSKNTQIKHFNIGFQNGFYRSFDMGNMILSQVGPNSSYEYIRSYKRESVPVLLFRSFSSEGINYHEFSMEEKNGEWVITDMYIYLTGEYVSERLKSTYVTNLYQILPEEADYYYEREKFKTYKLLEKAKVLADKGNHKKAFKTWEKISTNNRDDKLVQLAGIQIASFYNLELYNQLSLNYETKFPKDPGYYMVSLNGLFNQNAYEKSLQCIDSLSEVIGDPMLDYLRGGVYSEMGNINEATIAYNRLVESLPEFEPAYIELFELHVLNNDFQEATDVLDKMTLVFNYYKDDFGDFLENYPNYIKSDTYSNWVEK
ncbi:MAG: hypothetical protein MI922_01325 [Bacteroidales bacterium]|nr:hypothetical protein [Bacteroidales bacterium]